MGSYAIGQVCKNGHEITGEYTLHSAFAEDYCSKCGAETITQCEHCGTNIKGFYNPDDAFVAIPEFDVPSYCHGCGKPFPWTENALAVANELAQEIEGLNQKELEQAKTDLTDLTKDTPRTQIAIMRIRKLITKAGPVVGDVLKKTITEIATETVKKQLGL